MIKYNKDLFESELDKHIEFISNSLEIVGFGFNHNSIRFRAIINKTENILVIENLSVRSNVHFNEFANFISNCTNYICPTIFVTQKAYEIVINRFKRNTEELSKYLKPSDLQNSFIQQYKFEFNDSNCSQEPQKIVTDSMYGVMNKISPLIKNLLTHNYQDSIITEAIIPKENAKTLHKNECVSCGLCCNMKPCALAYEDIEKISNFLKIPKEEFISKYLCIDVEDIDGSDRIVITPIKAAHKIYAGTFIPASASWAVSPCIFFNTETSKCKIHDVKPCQGREYKCWEEAEAPAKKLLTDKETIKELFNWNGKDENGVDVL
jgi:Fe-S-cluster containining protein